jgi:mannan endo-1,4-beta-mannosidase
MRSRLVLLAAVSIAAVAVAFTGTRFVLQPSSPAVVRASLKPGLASYLGVFEPGSPPGSPPDYESISGFATVAGRTPNIAGYFSGWVQPFDSSFADALHSHNIIPFVQIDPSFASIADIAAGTYDGYLREYADSVKAFRFPVIIGFGQEMNAAHQYSWGYGQTPAPTFVAAWQHIVDVFRAEGADNVTWLWTIQADDPSTGPILNWWPGSSFVTWVGIDGFYTRPSQTFSSIFGLTIRQVRAIAPKKPVLLSETAVGPRAGQFVKIPNLFKGMIRYKTLGLVWFDVHQNGGINHQDWRLEDDPTGTAAFRLGVKDEVRSAARH